MSRDFTPLFHITAIDNLSSIVRDGALWANSLQPKAVKTIAYPEIQSKRANRSVPCGPRGVLHDYVPFYFCPRPPMLYAIHNGRVSGFEGPQSQILHLRSSVQTLVLAQAQFVFTDGHALTQFTEYYEDVAKLDGLDWEVIRSTRWASTEEEPDRKRRKQAEFLVFQKCPWAAIEEIGVFNHAARNRVNSILKQTSHQPRVEVRSRWYY